MYPLLSAIRGRARCAQGDLEEAKQFFEDALASGTQYGSIYSLQIECLRSNGGHQGVVEVLDAWLMRNPDNPSVQKSRLDLLVPGR